MRTSRHKSTRASGVRLRNNWRALSLLAVFLGSSTCPAGAQDASQQSLPRQIQNLSEAIARTQAQLDQSQRQLEEMRKQLSELQRQMTPGASSKTPAPPDTAPTSSSENTAAAIQSLRERQALQESEIATHDQTKVESESRYPVKITGLVLLNGFVNSGAVDTPATPTLALPGSGSTGASLRQTLLGFDARGPHLFGARSYADLRVDFNGRPAPASSTAGYSGYYGANALLLRLRTIHAGLRWEHTEAWFSLDHPILSPDTPTSLTAVAEPALAWSGNLWTWNPQLGITQEFGGVSSRGVQAQAALIDVGNAPFSPNVTPPGLTTATLPGDAERSRWPGVEARIALHGSQRGQDRSHFGIGGYFAPHVSSVGPSFNSWAATLDARLLLPARLQFTGSFYRGLALGGLGGGAYKDFAYRIDAESGEYYLRPLDDVGGWVQLKEKISERLEFNAAFGMDDAFAAELRQYANPSGSMAQNLGRNRTYSGNVIYSPSAYLLFSLEYRHLESSPVMGPTAGTNIVGLGTGYRF